MQETNINIIYQNLLKRILGEGYYYEDPNRKKIFRQELNNLNFSYIATQYPIISLRKIPFKNAVGELLLFLKGENDIRKYWKYGIKFWDKDVLKFHNLRSFDEAEEHQYSMGKIYPYQYRNGKDQLASVFNKFKEQPTRTDLVVNSWVFDDLSEMCLPPCHNFFQILSNGKDFTISFNMRSSDFILGFPINIQYYYLMGMILSNWTNIEFKGLYINLNKVHLYQNQFELASTMTFDEIKIDKIPYVTISKDLSVFNKAQEMIENLSMDDFTLFNYSPNLKNKSVEMLGYD